MKKLFYLMLAVSLVFGLTACNNDPEEEAAFFEFETATPMDVPASGGKYEIAVKSNSKWKVNSFSDNIVSVTPNKGTGNMTVEFEISANPGLLRSETINFVIDDGKIHTSEVFTIRQAADDTVIISLDKHTEAGDFAGGEVVVNLTANRAWTATADEAITVDPASGEGSAKVTITYPENATAAAVPYTVTFTADGRSEKDEIVITVAKPELVYGGVTYRIIKMKDGRWWMADNMRYVPEGKTVSTSLDNNTGIWNPVIFSMTASELAFYTSAADIEKYGLLYDLETALGGINYNARINPGGGAVNYTASNIPNEVKTVLEKEKGICPEGWYIPTADELSAMVLAHADESKPDALQIPHAMELGFYPGVMGCVIISNSTATPAFNRVAYGLSSTVASYTKIADDAETNPGRISIFMRELMQNRTYEEDGVTPKNNYIIVSNGSAFNGSFLKCIKAVPEEE